MQARGSGTNSRLSTSPRAHAQDRARVGGERHATTPYGDRGSAKEPDQGTRGTHSSGECDPRASCPSGQPYAGARCWRPGRPIISGGTPQAAEEPRHMKQLLDTVKKEAKGKRQDRGNYWTGRLAPP